MSRTTKAFEKAVASKGTAKVVLRLYVAGASARSRKALMRARELCETVLQGNCQLEVIDVYQHPILAREGQIIATPTLVREFPKPVRRLIGDLTNGTRLVIGLDLQSKAKARS